ncbi:LysR family transcriptional regulator [Verticiella sediminum]|nr:LysR family transcriptional regulator [Verticiella sediminum]
MNEDTNLSLLRRLNLNHLVSFLTVAESQTFRGAAARLHISQSALSVQIQQLEEVLRVRLFHRTTRSMALTAEGKRLLPVARHVTREVTLVTGDFWEEAALQRGVASLAATPSMAAGLVPPVMKAVADEHPGIKIELLVKDSSNDVADAVRQGDADLGLLSFSEEPKDLAVTPLRQDELVAVVPNSYTRLARSRQVTLRQLARFPFLIQPRGGSFREVLDRHLREQEVTIDIHQEILQAEVLVGLVGHGLGVAVLLERALVPLNLEGCRVIRLRGVRPGRVGLVSSPRRFLSPAVELLRRVTEEVSNRAWVYPHRVVAAHAE